MSFVIWLEYIYHEAKSRTIYLAYCLTLKKRLWFGDEQWLDYICIIGIFFQTYRNKAT